MIKVLFPLPKRLVVAFSGGVDSTAVVDFLSRNHTVSCAFYHHDTENSERAFDFVSKFCSERGITLLLGYLGDKKPKNISQEEFWRNKRYEFLESIDLPMVTAHNLDDCVETYLFGSLHGQPKVIPFRRNNILRPFLTTPKSEFVSWCSRKNVPWMEDQSNQDTAYMRNYIRHELMPHALHVNPGLNTVVKKLVEKHLDLFRLQN